MAIYTGKIWSNYHTINLPTAAELGIQGGLDARRATIFFRRAKAGKLPLLDRFQNEPDVNDQPEIEEWRDKQKISKDNSKGLAPNVNTHTMFTVPPSNGTLVDDYVAIIDIDASGLNQGYEVIKLPAIPRELEWNSESVFASIKPIGRNTAFYHYTGAEDKLSFEIDWYSTSWDSREVIRNCRRIESLSKADGYNGRPHRVMLKWGNGDVLFSGIYFQVISAQYKMVQFNKSRMSQNGGIESTHMLPVQAYQTVTLARIDQTNPSLSQIQYVSPNPL